MSDDALAPSRRPRGGRYVHVTEGMWEINYRSRPSYRPTLFVRIVDHKTEETCTRDRTDEEGAVVRVRPPGARWEYFGSVPPNSSAWRRPRKPRMTMIEGGNSYQGWTSVSGSGE
jgi:hypothetical protein